MGIFASYFWLWSIVGLVAAILLYSFGAMMNFAGFLTPLRRASQWLDRSTPRARLSLLGLLVLVMAYPSFVHKLWADATADGMRTDFEALTSFAGSAECGILPLSPTLPREGGGSKECGVVERLAGLYDPAASQGAYILGWFGTLQSRPEVEAAFRQSLGQRGWLEQAPSDGRTVRFVDGRGGASPYYELLLAWAAPRSSEVPPTVFAVRLGVLDPRVTAQVSWFIDCLVRWAPTLPSCEAGPWHPLDAVLRSSPALRFP